MSASATRPSAGTPGARAPGSNPGTMPVFFSPQAAPLVGVGLLAAAAAWFGLVITWGDMGVMPGTMGLGLGAFVVMWTLMVAAMMLPATAPLASLYVRSLDAATTSRTGRNRRLMSFLGGYVAVWAATALAAWAAARVVDLLVDGRSGTGVAVAATIFAAHGAYQLSGLKQRCLTKCRMPLSMLLEYLSWRGSLRDLRAGAHHGAYCLACCWTTMALLAAFGVMNLWAMAGLTALVTVEKLTSFGPALARAIGVASLVLALAVVWVPGLAPGLTGADLSWGDDAPPRDRSAAAVVTLGTHGRSGR